MPQKHGVHICSFKTHFIGTNSALVALIVEAAVSTFIIGVALRVVVSASWSLSVCAPPSTVPAHRALHGHQRRAFMWTATVLNYWAARWESASSCCQVQIKWNNIKIQSTCAEWSKTMVVCFIFTNSAFVRHSFCLCLEDTTFKIDAPPLLVFFIMLFCCGFPLRSCSLWWDRGAGLLLEWPEYARRSCRLYFVVSLSASLSFWLQ